MNYYNNSSYSGKYSNTKYSSSQPPSYHQPQQQQTLAPKQDGIVDMETFSQLLEMDDDETHGFSKDLAMRYVEQARTTLKSMEDSAQTHSLSSLSQQGHFLKGSSSALGLSKVKDTCEKMQYAGLKKDTKGGDITETEAIRTCKELLEQLKVQNKEAEQWLTSFYK